MNTEGAGAMDELRRRDPRELSDRERMNLCLAAGIDCRIEWTDSRGVRLITKNPVSIIWDDKDGWTVYERKS